jgi:hypothetical protein
MGYFDNLDNGLLSKYKKIKIEKNYSYIYFYLYSDNVSNLYIMSLSFFSPSKTVESEPL